MRVYSAGEAIGPAWEHTKALMWEDRRWGRLLKLGLVALGAELGSGFNVNASRFSGRGGHIQVEAGILAGIVLVALVFGLLLFVLFLYLGSRLQLVQFDMLVLRNPMVAPAWERHGRHTWRWAGLKVAVILGVLLCLLPLLIPAIPLFLAFLKQVQPITGAAAGHPQIHWAALLLLFAEVIAIVVVAVLLIRFVTGLILPGLALEDLSFPDALARGWQLFRVDIPGMLLFAVLQPLFLLLVGLVLGFGMVLILLVLGLPFGLVAFLIWHGTQTPGTATFLLLGTLLVLAVVVVGAVMACVYVATSGTLLMFARAWSLYFLGGRYPLLGEYLEPSPAVPVWTPPPSFPAEDEDDGPGFPGDPALA